MLPGSTWSSSVWWLLAPAPLRSSRRSPLCSAAHYTSPERRGGSEAVSSERKWKEGLPKKGFIHITTMQYLTKHFLFNTTYSKWLKKINTQLFSHTYTEYLTASNKQLRCLALVSSAVRVWVWTQCTLESTFGKISPSPRTSRRQTVQFTCGIAREQLLHV